MKNAKIGTGLVLDAQKLATGVSACIGIRGSGKTNGAAVIAERVLNAGIPVIVIDQVGPWFSLRLAKDGKHPSPYAIPVLGGSHGDIALLPQTGRQVAEALAQSGSSAVLDVSMMRKGERVRFAADFAEAFFEAMKRNKRPVLLVVEESQRFMPQVMRFSDPALSRCLGAFEEIAEVGRNFGIGMVLISQRPQQINKNVLFLSDTLFAFRTLGVAERKTIAEWVKEKGAAGREEVADELPGLKAGNAVVWSPAVFEVYGHFKIDLKETYDASATPDKALAAVRTKPLDLSALERTMATVVAEAKANDPAALKAQVADLKRQLEKGAAARPVAPPKVVEKPVLTEAQMKRMEALGERAGAAGAKIVEALSSMQREINGVRASITSIRSMNGGNGGGAGGPTPVLRPRLGPDLRPLPEREPSGAPIGDAGDGAGAGITGGATRMLEALAATSKDGLTRRELGAIAQVKASGGTFDTYLSRLRKAGYIENGGDGIRLTDQGRIAAGDVPRLTGEALLRSWLPKLGGKPALMLQVLYEARAPVGKEDLAQAVGIAASGGTFDTYLSRLKSRGLVDRVSGGYQCAAVLRS